MEQRGTDRESVGKGTFETVFVWFWCGGSQKSKDAVCGAGCICANTMQR